MRLRYQILLTLTIFALAGIWMMTGSGTTSVSTADGIIPDDEIAFVDSSRYIQIQDPHTAAGTDPFTWTSPTLGWTDMAVLDANADGVDELVAIGGNKVQMLTPYTPPGTVVPQFSRTVGSGYDYVWVATGDFIPGDDGRDEILVQRTDSRADCEYSIQIFDGDDAGANWTMELDNCYGTDWIRIRAGEVDGLEGDEVVMIRNGPPGNRDKRLLIMKYAPDGSWPIIFQKSYDFVWLEMATGNTHLNNGDIDEIILSREDLEGQLPSLLVFQYHANNVSTAPDGKFAYVPSWLPLATGDVNNSGDDELFMVRDPIVAKASLLGRNWGSDSMPAGWTSPGLALGRNLKEVQMGDVDGDEKAEVVIGQVGSYRIYTEPGSNQNHSGDKPASFNSPTVIRLGNFDGQGVVTGPAKLAVDKTSLQFEMTRGESDPPAQTFMVYNDGGGGSIAYNVTRQIDDGNWLNVTPFDGATAQTHTVSIDSSGLSAGVHDGTITISAADPEVEDSPRPSRCA